MKLLSKTQLYYQITAWLIFAAGTCVFYLMLEKIVNDETNEKLEEEHKQVVSNLDKLGKVPEQFFVVGDQIEIHPASGNLYSKPFLKDTSVYNTEEKETLAYRRLLFSYKQGESYYTISISRALFESDDLLTTIVKAMLIIMLSLVIAILLINRWISKKLWTPFYHTLGRLKNYTITDLPAAGAPSSGILEFDELNRTIEKMEDKMHRDYISLKDFSENASHEIQTPLAIIKSKLELLIQSKGLSEEQSGLIGDVYEGANRLSKLNQALILLTRIGNLQYPDIKSISVKALVQTKLSQLEDLIVHKKINVEQHMEEAPVWEMNPVLADVLISNLLGNAIKHNLSGGKLILHGTKQSLVINNTGEPLNGDPGHLFERFRKNSSSGDSLGLGLAIARQICDSYGISISYTYGDHIHRIELNSPLKPR